MTDFNRRNVLRLGAAAALPLAAPSSAGTATRAGASRWISGARVPVDGGLASTYI
jgi:hypothetical protein